MLPNAEGHTVLGAWSDEPWMTQAACRGLADHWDITPQGGLDARMAAQRTCLDCPVMVDCRAYGIRNKLDGVFGGVPLIEGRRKHLHYWPRGGRRSKSSSVQLALQIVIDMGYSLSDDENENDEVVTRIMEELSCQRKWARHLLRQALYEQTLEKEEETDEGSRTYAHLGR